MVLCGRVFLGWIASSSKCNRVIVSDWLRTVCGSEDRFWSSDAKLNRFPKDRGKNHSSDGVWKNDVSCRSTVLSGSETRTSRDFMPSESTKLVSLDFLKCIVASKTENKPSCTYFTSLYTKNQLATRIGLQCTKFSTGVRLLLSAAVNALCAFLFSQ